MTIRIDRDEQQVIIDTGQVVTEMEPEKEMITGNKQYQWPVKI